MNKRAETDDGARMRADLESFLNEHLNDGSPGWPRTQELESAHLGGRHRLSRWTARRFVALRAGLLPWARAVRARRGRSVDRTECIRNEIRRIA